MSYTITRPTDWWVFSPEHGFVRIGGCSEEFARKFKVENYPDYDYLMQASDLYTMRQQVEKAIEWQQEVEYEHTENMRHDAERD